MLISFAFSPGIQHQKRRSIFDKKRSNLTFDMNNTSSAFLHITKCFATVEATRKPTPPLLCNTHGRCVSNLSRSETYWHYKNPCLFGLNMFTTEKRPFIYDGIGIKKASYSLCSRLTTLWYHKWSELFVGKAMSKSMFHWGYLREWPTYVEQKRV